MMELHCNFCGKSQDEVECLIAGPGTFICDGCVVLCTVILAERQAPEPKAQELSEASIG